MRRRVSSLRRARLEVVDAAASGRGHAPVSAVEASRGRADAARRLPPHAPRGGPRSPHDTRRRLGARRGRPGRSAGRHLARRADALRRLARRIADRARPRRRDDQVDARPRRPRVCHAVRRRRRHHLRRRATRRSSSRSRPRARRGGRSTPTTRPTRGSILAKDGTVVFAAGRKVYGVTPQGFVKWRFAAKRKVFTSPGGRGRRSRVLRLAGPPRVRADAARRAGVERRPRRGRRRRAGARRRRRCLRRDGRRRGRPARSQPTVTSRGARTSAATCAARCRSTRDGDVARGRVRSDASRGASRARRTARSERFRPDPGHGRARVRRARRRARGRRGRRWSSERRTTACARSTHGGQLLWSFTTGGDVDAPVTLLDDGSVVFGSDDGKVYMLRGN